MEKKAKNVPIASSPNSTPSLALKAMNKALESASTAQDLSRSDSQSSSSDDMSYDPDGNEDHETTTSDEASSLSEGEEEESEEESEEEGGAGPVLSSVSLPRLFNPNRSEIRYTTSQKKGKSGDKATQLVAFGFRLRCKKQPVEGKPTKWICVKYDRFGCKGTAVTTDRNGEPVAVNQEGWVEHDHDPDREACIAHELTNEMKVSVYYCLPKLFT